MTQQYWEGERVEILISPKTFPHCIDWNHNNDIEQLRENWTLTVAMNENEEISFSGWSTFVISSNRSSLSDDVKLYIQQAAAPTFWYRQ